MESCLIFSEPRKYSKTTQSSKNVLRILPLVVIFGMLWSVMVVFDHSISLITRKDPLLKVLAEGWLESKDNYFQTFQKRSIWPLICCILGTRYLILKVVTCHFSVKGFFELVQTTCFSPRSVMGTAQRSRRYEGGGLY